MALQKLKLFDSLDQVKSITNGQIKVIKVGHLRYCLLVFQEKVLITELGCPHMGHPLNQGFITPFGEISCPLHSYRFDLKYGEESNQRCRPLKIYKTEVLEDGVYGYLPP